MKPEAPSRFGGILRRLPLSEPLVVALDFDGTVVPIRRDYRSPVLSGATRRLLSRLASAPRTKLVFVTGRMLPDIRRRAPVPKAAYLGNHGLEGSDGGWRWTHAKAVRARPAVRRLSRMLAGPVSRVPGAALEDKALTLSIHYRKVRTPAAVADLDQQVRAALARAGRGIRILHGKKLWNIKPDVGWNKGLGLLRWMADTRRKGAVVFLGDDRTDEEGFRALGARAVAVRVGPGPTAARHRIRQDDVLPLLKALWAQRSGTKAS